MSNPPKNFDPPAVNSSGQAVGMLGAKGVPDRGMSVLRGFPRCVVLATGRFLPGGRQFFAGLP
jgi:hypothetical protein